MARFNQKEILVVGGGGLLGRELKKLLPSAQFPSSKELDIVKPAQVGAYFKNHRVGLVIHAGAFMPPAKSETEPAKAIAVNIVGTANLVTACIQSNIKITYISTDYVFKGDGGNYKEDDPVFPVNKYAWSKLGGECAVRLCDKHLIIRTSFGAKIFPYEKAFSDHWTSREAVDAVAKKIVRAVNKGLLGTLHIGGSRKTVHDYAKKLNPKKKLGKVSRLGVNYVIPKDTSLNMGLFKRQVG